MITTTTTPSYICKYMTTKYCSQTLVVFGLEFGNFVITLIG
jgi:hypothetical protein